MEDLEEFIETGKYARLINPSILFKNIEEFKVFLEIDPTKENLEATLKICEQEELYEYCKLVKQKLNDFK